MPKPKRILVIDDDDKIRLLMHDILKQAGYEVAVTPYLATAIGEALSGVYDLISLDLRMPSIDGREIAELFQHQNLNTSVLVVSGYLDPAITEQLRKIGITHFLSKPFTTRGLLNAVEKALGEP